MKTIIVYLVAFAAADLAGITFLYSRSASPWFQWAHVVLTCGLVGGLGGVVYCLRAVYLNASVLKVWDTTWYPWYFIRPIVSHLCGLVGFVFLKSGLLLLEAKKSADASDLGFLAFAFIAGFNVDKFITKLEDIAQATWGVEKSRASKRDETPKGEKPNGA